MGHHRARDGDEQPDDLTVEQVRSTLRDAADAYRPDRTAIVDRVASGRAAAGPAGGARRALFRMNPIAAGLAVAVVLVAGISAARVSSGPDRTAATDRPPAGAPTVAGPGSPSPSTPDSSPPAGPTPAGPTAAGPAGTTGSTSSRAPSGRPRTGPPATAAPNTGTTSNTGTASNGVVSSRGALDRNSDATWSQQNVTITTGKPIVALTVTVTVALTPGATVHGKYTTAPNHDVTMTATPTATSLTYSYVLNDGRRLMPGTYLFAAQFAHRPGRDGADAYTVVARTADGDVELSGTFAR